ncbi:hypothetical protein Tco_0869932 [Tanacetum coccineum]
MTNERTQDILNKSKRNHNANSKKKDGFIQLEINVERRGVNKDDNDLKVDVKVREGREALRAVVEVEEWAGDGGGCWQWAGDGGGYWQWARDGDGCWQWGWRLSDTSYPPVRYDVSNLLPRQRIDLCSLNNVIVLPNNMAYSVRSIRRTALQQIYAAYSNKLNTAYLSSDTVAVKIFAFDFLFYVFSSLRAHPTDNLCLFSGNRLTKKGITMVEPNEYIFVTRKNFLSNDNEGRVIEKSFVEIQGTATSEWFKKDCIGSVTTWENLVEKFIQKFYQLSDNNEEMESDEDDDPNDIDKIFMIDRNLFDYETPLCKAFNDFNYLLKIDTDLFAFDIQGIKTYEEYELNNNMTGDLEEPWSDNGAHKWYDELTDGKLKDESLMYKAKVKESWGDATPGVMKLYAWLKNSFENFHKLDHDVLVKLEESNNAGNTQDNQGPEEHRDNPTHDPSVCKIKRFKMMKYSFNVDKEYIAIKESEHLNYSKDNLDVYRELLRIINKGWLVATSDDE